MTAMPQEADMTLENQVCSLESSKRLATLGVKQESYFTWMKLSPDSEWTIADDFLDYGGDRLKALTESGAYYSAFTSTELGEMLPDRCPQHGGILNIRRGFGKWLVGYGEHQEMNGCHVEGEENEADARAKMLIYFIENKLITV